MITVQHFALDDRIHFKEALSLVKAGFKVTIIHSSETQFLVSSSGDVLNSKGEEAVLIDGINLIRVIGARTFLQRTLKKIYAGEFYKKIALKAIDEQADIYIAHEPQSIGIAVEASQACGAKMVFDAHESLHFFHPKDKYSSKKWMHDLRYFTTANKRTAETLLEWNPSALYEVIHNASLFPIPELKEETEIQLVHEGSFPFNRGLELLMEAMLILKELHPSIKLKIIGSVKGEEEAYFKSTMTAGNLEANIELTGWKRYEQVPDELNGSSIGLILNTFTPNNLYGGPANKLFNYINAGLAVVSVDLPETSEIIRAHGCGVILPERTAEELANTLSSLIHDPTRTYALRRAAHEAAPQLSWSEEAKKMVAFYTSVAADHSS